MMHYRGRGGPAGRTKRLCYGIGCMAAGIIVLVLFLPDWLFALAAAGLLFRIGIGLIGPLR